MEVATKKEKMMVDTQNILYVEKRGKQCVVHLEDGEVVCYISLKQLFAQLNQEKFCYVHQGYVVNFEKIKDKIYRLRQERVEELLQSAVP